MKAVSISETLLRNGVSHMQYHLETNKTCKLLEEIEKCKLLEEIEKM